MSTEQTEPPAPTDAPAEPARAPRRRRLLPTLVIICALGLAAGLLVHRVGPRPVPPPVVPAYTPQQSAQAEADLDTLREQLTRPAPPPGVPSAPDAQTNPPAQPQPQTPRPRAMRLELSQQDLNAYLATNPNAKLFLARQGVKAVQIIFQPPSNLLIRAAVLYRGRPANVQITGRVQPSPRTLVRLVATGAQVGRLPIPPKAVSAQADKLAAQFTRKLRGRLPFSVRAVQVVGDRLVLTGVAQEADSHGARH